VCPLVDVRRGRGADTRTRGQWAPPWWRFEFGARRRAGLGAGARPSLVPAVESLGVAEQGTERLREPFTLAAF
jgi:hypothetical protein